MTRRLALTLGLALLAGHALASEPPRGWFAAGSTPASYDMGVQAGDRHPGDRNAYIRSLPKDTGFGTLMQTIDAAPYHGKRLRLSGYLRTRDAASAAMWMRIDGANQRVVGFDNMKERALRGSVDWQRCDIVLDVPDSARAIAFGFLLEGKGEVLADDFRLEDVGKDVPVTGKPEPALPTAPVNLDFSQ
jgi:hypothetical protein